MRLRCRWIFGPLRTTKLLLRQFSKQQRQRTIENDRDIAGRIGMAHQILHLSQLFVCLA